MSSDYRFSAFSDPLDERQESSEDVGDSESDFDDPLLRALIASKDTEELQPGLYLGEERRFEINRRVGSGGMGTVYVAIDHRLRRPVAMKTLRTARQGPQAAEAARREAATLAKLHHPGIVQVYDTLTWQGRPVIVLEFVEGETLADRLLQGPVPVRDALGLMRQVAEAVAYAHDLGVIHRDLKPANLLVTGRGRVRVLDFGLAWIQQAIDESDPSAQGVGPGMPTRSAGTPAYMAPEQYRGEAPGPWTDLWALGMILHELLFGYLPYLSSGLEGIRAAALSPSAFDIPELSWSALGGPLRALLGRLLAKDPARRMGSAMELHTELATIERIPETSQGPQLRPVTLLACQQVGLADADVEDTIELQRTTRNLFESVMRSHGVTAMSLRGDSLRAFFGFPRAQEDCARHAALAALALSAGIRENLTRLNASRERLFGAGVGIHVGRALISPTYGSAETLPVIEGDVPTVAGWLARLARPGTVQCTQEVCDTLKDTFVLHARGLVAEENRRGQRQVFEIVSPVANDPLDPGQRGQQPLFVGREEAMSTLLEHWSAVEAGLSGAVLLVGEAGMGKTRLAREFLAQPSVRHARHLTCRCAAEVRFSALKPFINLMSRSMGVRPEDPPEVNLGRIRAELDALGLNPDQYSGVLTDMLGLHGARAGVAHREDVIAAFIDILRAFSASYLTILIIEDLHWADDSSLELVRRLLAMRGEMRLFLLLTTRPPLPAGALVREIPTIRLDLLGQREVRLLVERMSETWPLSMDLTARIAERSEGVPLYVIELVRLAAQTLALRRNEAENPSVVLPLTLQDLLNARLDQLTEERETLNFAAVLGPRFDQDLLAELAGLSRQALGHGLDRLVRAGLLDRPNGARGEVRFHHVLLREAAYLSIPRGKRRELHQRVADLLLAGFPEISSAEPELLAQHLTAANRSVEAIPYWVRAGMRCVQASAHREAIANLEAAREALASIEDPAARERQELEVLTLLGVSLTATRGYSAVEAEQAYGRALRLSQSFGEDEKLVPALRGLWQYHFARGNFQGAQDLGEQILRLAARSGSASTFMLGHRLCGTTLFAQGRMLDALARFDEVERLTWAPDAPAPSALAREHGLDPLVAATCYKAWIFWLIGRRAEAVTFYEASITRAERSEHPHTVAFAHSYGAVFHQFREDAPAAQASARAAIALAQRYHLGYWLAWSTCVLGWSMARLGDPEGGLQLLQRGSNGWVQAGSETGLTYFLVLLAEVALELGRREVAAEALQRASGIAVKNGERYYEAQLHRAQGRLLTAQGPEHAEEARQSAERSRQVAAELGLVAPDALAALRDA